MSHGLLILIGLIVFSLFLIWCLVFKDIKANPKGKVEILILAGFGTMAVLALAIPSFTALYLIEGGMK